MRARLLLEILMPISSMPRWNLIMAGAPDACRLPAAHEPAAAAPPALAFCPPALAS
jgi:hypothetical protein